MRKITVFGFIALLALAGVTYAQEHRGLVRGRIYDAASRKPVAYANVILFNQKDSTLVTGTTSKDDGSFQINRVPPGSYYANIQFIGYKTQRFESITIAPAKYEIDLGKISLQETMLQVEAVEVQAEALAMTYQIDKKVVNVSQQQTAISGTAVDVLENVPAVTVDIEGNVRLRGSGNFTVLVDGQPSVLEPSEALQQIPASTIENIEIITNPSAKYDPEGTSGIINIVLKRERREGRSGIANLNAGTGDKLGGDLLYDHKSEIHQATAGVDYNRRLSIGNEREENQTTHEGLTSHIASEGGSWRKDISLGLRAELKLDFRGKDLLSFGGRYGYRDSQRGANLDYAEWSAPESAKLLYTSTTDRFRNRSFYGMNFSWLHRFAPKGHELTAEVFYRRREGDEATTNGLRQEAGELVGGQRTTEAGPSRDLRARIDYTLTFGKEAKFEAGYLSDFDLDDEITGLAEFDTSTGDYLILPQFSNRTRYDEKTHALYAMSGGEWGRFGYQVGLRGEYTGRSIAFDGAPEPFTLGRWDYFPTLHLSHQFAVGQQAMASYTRRINRPDGGELEPFQTWDDAYNVRVGNPALKPEYIDSYEIAYQTHLGASLVSIETYFRQTRNRIEDVRSVYAENVTLHSVENIGEDYALGSEVALNFDLHKKWNVNLTGNFYGYRIEGALFGESLSRESFTWNSRCSNSIKLSRFLQFQLDGLYNSASVSSQGSSQGFFVTNVAVKYEIFEKLLSATMQVRDLFGSAKNESISRGADFYNYSYSLREAPVVMLNLKYNFNNYKPERRQNREEGGEEEGGS
ncbi:MAG: TonB-dependent receptor domain-containing protein [bacterium]